MGNRKEWLDEPNESGWWWCLQDKRSGHKPGRLVAVMVEFYPGEETGTVVPTRGHDFIGYTGEYGSDITGKWQGPIEEPI